MPLGRTYAELVVGVLGLIYFGEPAPVDDGRQGMSITLGANSTHKDGPGQDAILALTAYGADHVWEKFTPVYGFGASSDGAVYASFGLGKQINVLGGTLTPFSEPAIYQRDISDGFDGKALFQFRTGVDLSFPIGEKTALTAGWYHMSNMKLTDRSAGIDVTHAGFVLRF